MRNTRYSIVSLKYILLYHCQKSTNKNTIIYCSFYTSTIFYFESCRFYKTIFFVIFYYHGNILSNNSVSRKYLDKYRTSAMHLGSVRSPLGLFFTSAVGICITDVHTLLSDQINSNKVCNSVQQCAWLDRHLNLDLKSYSSRTIPFNIHTNLTSEQYYPK